MTDVIASLFAMSVAGSAVVGLMLLLRPITAKFFSANWQYTIGKIAIAFFLLPVFLFAANLPLVQLVIEIYPYKPSAVIPKVLPAPLTQSSKRYVGAMEMEAVIEKHLTVELIQVVLLIWLVGVIVFAGWHLYCYRRFSKQLWAESLPAPQDTVTTTLISSCKEALGIRSAVKLRINPNIKSPMLVGLYRPIILLPTSNMQALDLKLVLTHELMHLKHKDLWVKMLALLAGTVHWFNPLAHVLRKDVSTWGELSCDEALATKMSLEERKRYGEAILNTLDNHSGINTAFCSSLCESRRHIERRLLMLLNVKRMKKHIAVFATVALMAVAIAGTTMSALAAENASLIGAKQLGNQKTVKNQEQEVEDISALGYATISIGSMDNIKFIELKGDGKEYTFEEFRQWLEAARLEAAELVKSGTWTQEQADKRLALYEDALADIEEKGGRTFGKLIDRGEQLFPDRIEVFYTTDELVFELPATLADATNGEVGFGLSVQPKR